MDSSAQASREVLVTPMRGWTLADARELWDYRELFGFLVWRELKARYAQTVLGFGWAVFEPLIQIGVFSIIFGNIARLPTDDIPYVLFVTTAIIPWQYMSSAMSQSGQSLVNFQALLGKIYFPRVLFPITPVLTNLVAFAISLLLLVAVMIFYRVTPTWNILLLPLFLIFMVLIPAAAGLWLSALAIRFRDVRILTGFMVRMLMWSTPVVYSASSIPDKYRFWYSLNPLVGVVEGIRAALLGQSLNWWYILPGMAITLIILVTGAWYFRRMEHIFVDVI